MPLKFRCPKCEKKLAVADKLAGKAIRCPNCKAAVRIPRAKKAADERSSGEPKKESPTAAASPAEASSTERPAGAETPPKWKRPNEPIERPPLPSEKSTTSKKATTTAADDEKTAAAKNAAGEPGVDLVALAADRTDLAATGQMERLFDDLDEDFGEAPASLPPTLPSPVRLRLSVSASTSIATPLGP